MSSILKALRRLEEERARKSTVAPEIAANLLRVSTRRSLTPHWVWAAIITAGAAGVTTLLLLWLWKPLPVTSMSVTAQAVPAPPAVVSASGSGQGGTLIIEEVIDQQRPVLLPEPALSAPPSRSLSVEEKTVAPEKNLPAAKEASEAAPAGERLTPVVTAIAWQEESSARMAVVDGLPVMTGEAIGALRVEEILPDRIIFTEDNGRFVVRLHPQ